MVSTPLGDDPPAKQVNRKPTSGATRTLAWTLRSTRRVEVAVGPYPQAVMTRSWTAGGAVVHPAPEVWFGSQMVGVRTPASSGSRTMAGYWPTGRPLTVIWMGVGSPTSGTHRFRVRPSISTLTADSADWTPWVRERSLTV